MRRRRFLVLAGASGALAVRRVSAQQAAAPLVGILRTAGSDDDLASRAIITRLGELGFEDGRNVAFAIRSIDSRRAGAAVAAEFARLRPAVMVVSDAAVVPALRGAMPATPVVTVASDLVAMGLAQSVARPGGLLTGVSLIFEDLSTKRLEFLAEALPRPTMVLILADPAFPAGTERVRAAAPALGLTLQVAEVSGLDEIERAIETRAASVSGIGVVGSPLFAVHHRRIIALAAAARLPVVFHWAEFGHDGALIAYGPSLIEISRLLAGQVERILRGERAADIPIERPTRITLVINLRVARELGLAIPPALLARADEVIE
jgi:putative ABC transport system substrate-binding protein